MLGKCHSRVHTDRRTYRLEKDELNDMTKELDHLRKQFDDTRNALEQETLSRFDLENTIQSCQSRIRSTHRRSMSRAASARQRTAKSTNASASTMMAS
ncbi:lamin Dm0-like [Drosophila eugracilis]|uniref:lamin Dm0-like n=1 Tax=Drosophila eugracilis TaxID=29029 RepID=UPI0007E67171|nr:lamin Dm0-like [Drosophila eugracilis]